MTIRKLIRMMVALAIVALALPLQAQQLPEDVEARDVDIRSEGTRMSGTVFTPSDAPSDEQLPAILMAHGWGGVAAQLRRDAVAFARAGYLVVTFDYRGWGDSDGRVILEQPKPPDEDDVRFTAEVREIREVVDPVDMLTDWQNALHWLHGEPRVDTDRIGLWGSSQSGGYVVEMAARDPRVSAVHSQVGSMDGASIGRTPEAYEQATRRARGEASYPEPGEQYGGLRGAPIASRFTHYAPVDTINQAGDTPIQFVLAEEEELFDNRNHGILAHDRYEGPKRLVIIPDIDHYGIYREAWERANGLALEWFDRYLNPQGSR